VVIQAPIKQWEYGIYHSKKSCFDGI
jgi:hypothetical protein